MARPISFLLHSNGKSLMKTLRLHVLAIEIVTINVLKRFKEPLYWIWQANLFATPKLHFPTLNVVTCMIQTQLIRISSVSRNLKWLSQISVCTIFKENAWIWRWYKSYTPWGSNSKQSSFTLLFITPKSLLSNNIDAIPGCICDDICCDAFNRKYMER